MSEDASAPLLHQVTEILGQEPDLHVVIAFSSAAGRNFRPDSDLDIAVWSCEGPLSSARRQELIARLGEVTGRPIDLVDLATAGVLVSQSALTEGRRLIVRDDAALAGLITRMLFDSADFLPLRERVLRERREAWIGP